MPPPAHVPSDRCCYLAALPSPLPCSFWLREPWVHDLSLDQFAELTVFSNGGGGNINFDCHRAGEKQKHDWFAAAVFVPKRGGGGGGGGGRAGGGGGKYRRGSLAPCPPAAKVCAGGRTGR